MKNQMNFKIDSLTLNCKRSKEIINFSQNISYFHGKSGSGKSSIARLIDYCLGGNLERTEAISSQALSTSISCIIGDYNVIFERDIKPNDELRVSWFGLNNEIESLDVPIKRMENPIWKEEVYNLSDLIFYFLDIKPIKVRRSRRDVESKLITLSFRNIMWYCYLSQKDIDSNFFNLDEVFLKEHSQNVMRFITGDYTETMSELEQELYNIRDKKKQNYSTIEELKKFLLNFGYDTEEKINSVLNKIDSDIIKYKNIITSIRYDINPNQHSVDNLKDGLRNLTTKLSDKKNIIEDLKLKIENEESLKYDYITAKFKLSRTESAVTVLSKAQYSLCPLCGKELLKLDKDDACPVCKQPNIVNIDNIEHDKDIRKDIDEKVDELDEVIEKHKKSLNMHNTELNDIELQKNYLDMKLNEDLKLYDSKYLSRALEYEKNISELIERKRNLINLLKMPRTISDLSKENNELDIKEKEIKINYDKEKIKLTYVEKYIKELQQIFLNSLIEIKYPGIDPEDEIIINRNNWMPIIISKEEGIVTNFYNTGSGGKKTLFNACYALSIHILAKKYNLPLPNFIIIDTPMKNISERVDTELFESFYNFIYKLLLNELKETQLILIDKEFYPPPKEYPLKIYPRYMTKDDANNPPLITYWKE